MDAAARIAAPLEIGGVEFLPNGLRIPDGMGFDDWLELGDQLRDSMHGHQWWIGDWLRFGGHRYGDRFESASSKLGLKPSYLRNLKYVAECYPDLSLRSDKCPFKHHQIAAPLPPQQRTKLLTKAADEQWSSSRLRQEIPHVRPRIAEQPRDEESPGVIASLSELDGQQFGTIYADPPWQYGNQATRASTDDHYGTMTVDELCLLPVERYAADAAHLHLWTTNGFLPDAFRVMSSWGFEYRSCFVWVKPQMGIGNYWRVSHEFLLLGIRGDAKRFNSRSLKSWGEFKRGRHSAKPEKIRDMIEQASPGPYLEMFGRRRIDGWTVMGNQVENGLFA